MDSDVLSKALEVIKGKASGTFQVFERRDYYVAYGDDARKASVDVLCSEASLKFATHTNGDKIVYLNMNKNQFARIVREMLVIHQYRVELYACTGKGGQWDLKAKGSPGYLSDFEDVFGDTFDIRSSGSVVAIKSSSQGPNKSEKIWTAACDRDKMTLTTSHFSDDEAHSHLRALLLHLNPKECYVLNEGGSATVKALSKTASDSKVFCTTVKLGSREISETFQDLNKLLKFEKGEQKNSSAKPELKEEGVVSCVAVLIQHLGLMKGEEVLGRLVLQTYQLGQHLRLDPSVAHALELFRSPSGYGKDGSLFGLLNRCRTPTGQKTLEEWVRQPLVDKRKIEERLDAVELLGEKSRLRMEIKNVLARTPNTFTLARRIAGKRASLMDCVKIYQLVKSIPRLLEYLQLVVSEGDSAEKGAAIKELLIEPLQVSKHNFEKYTVMIEETVDFEHHAKEKELRIRPQFDPNLQELADGLDEVTSEMDGQLKKAAKELELEKGKAIRLENTVQSGWVYRVTKKDEKVLRGSKKYHVLETQKAYVGFTNNGLDPLREKYKEVWQQYSALQKEVIQNIVDIAAGYLESLRALSSTIGYIDVLTSFAEVSTSSREIYCRPIIKEKGSGIINLTKCRHPCMEAIQDISFIPNDVHMEKGKSTLSVVTGPNMGGKSTFLRQTALSVLLAQMGCFVPCETATISLVDAIFTRVGAADDEQRGVSTFMAEMLDSALILRAATSDSLVIIDELGRGTSTYDGFGIAWAIAEQLVKETKCFTLFATHFQEITLLREEYPEVRNLHVLASVQNDQLTLLHNVVEGVTDRSFGINVAKTVGFPAHVINAAWEKLSVLESCPAV